MENAKRELLILLEDKIVICATLKFDDLSEAFNLKKGYTPEEYYKFFGSIDIDYDDGFGIQVITGCVWFEDNQWLERCEYDGSEWWELKKYPDIPEFLL